MLRMETNSNLRPSGPGSISDDDLEDLFHLDFSSDIYRQIPSSNLDILAEELDIYNGSNTSDPSPGMGLTTTLNVDQSLPYPGKEKGQVAALISGPSYSYQSEALGLPKTSSTNPSLSYLSDTMGIATTSNTNSSVSYMLDTMNLPAISNASSISSYLSETPKLETKSSNPIEKIMESSSSSLPSVNMDLPEISNPCSSFSNSSLDSELSETSNTNPDHRLSYSSFNIKPPKNSSTVGSSSPYPSVDFVSSSVSSTDPSLPYSSVNTGLINTSVGIPSTFSLLKNSYAINHFDTGQNLRDINYTNTNYLGTHVEPKNLAESWNPHLSGVYDEDEEVFSSSLEALNLLNPGILNNYNKEIFGTIKSEIINVSMFKTKVLDNETVFLRKAPDMFDRFTIRVDNRSMDQIGVIKRDHSSALAYIIDNNLASVEGKVHYNADCIFRIPVEIKLSGESSKKAEVLRHFKRYGISVIPHYDSLGHMPEHESPLPFDYDYDHVISSRTFVTPAEMENQLDEMFKTLDEGDKVTEAKAALAVKTPLYPHQKQALNWMICKENNDLLPPFWEKRGTLYLNTLTRKKTAEKPKSIYGGILADDMGLGKTLEMISLIVTNFVNGQPLAEPLPGFYRESFVKSSRTAQVRLRSENDSRGSPESGSNSFINSPPALRLNLSVLNNMNKEMEETEASPLSSEMVSNSSSSFSPSRGIKRSNYDATDEESIESIFGQGKGKGIGKKSKYHDMNIWESGTDRRPDVASDFVDLTLPETDKQSILTDSSSGLNISNGFTSSSMSYDQMMALSTNTLRTLAYAAARSEPIGSQFIEAAKTTHISNTLDSVIDVDALPESNTYEDITPVDSPDVIEVHEGSQDFKFNTIDSNLVRNHQDYITRPSASKLDFFAIRSSSQKLDTIVISDSEDELPDIIMPLNMKKEKINIKDDLPDIIHPLDLTKRKNIGFTEMKKSEVNYFRREPDLIDEIIPWKKRVVTSSTDPQTGRTITDGPRGTLIICPLSVISNWVEQFDEHVDKSVKILLHVYYGPKRTTDVAFLLEQDVIITTYATLSSDFKKGYASPLHQIEWLRIVLDEGHTIRNPAAQQTKAIFELQADRKWILSGTPIQNSLKDLWSLINFLQVKPFTEKKTWNRIIAGPLVKRERQALKRVAHLVRNLAMRRTKNQQLNGKPIVSLPARHVYLETVSLSREERVYYDAMQTNGRDIIGSYYRKGTLLNNYGTVLTILLRLRQLCCHPQLVAMAASKKNPDAVFQDIVGEDPKQPNEHKEKLIKQLKSVLESGSDEECSICLESLKEPVITACAHFYCKLCIEAVIEKNEEASCPMCRAPLDKKELYGVQDGMDDKDGMDNDLFHFNPNEYYSSSKVDALMKALNQLRQEDPRIKSVVVSQFTSLLTLLETPLKEQGFNFVRLDGTMRANDRSQAVRDFSDPSLDSPTIFLLSLKAGGVGINLTAASRVFLLDPAWNPAAEDQCFDRCHRLGQTKDVVITKFVIEDSVEKRMLELQEKKRQLINGVLDKKLSADQRRKIRIDEIKTLFNI